MLELSKPSSSSGVDAWKIRVREIGGARPTAVDAIDLAVRSVDPPDLAETARFANVAPQNEPPPSIRIAAIAVGAAIATLLQGLYTRFTSRKAALSHPKREQLITIVDEEPGIALKEVQRRMSMPRGSVAHHLAVLERLGLIRVQVMNGRTMLYPGGATLPAGKIEEALMHPTKAVFVRPLLARALTREQLHALAPRIPRRTRNHVISGLIATGVVRIVAVDGRPTYMIA